MEKIQVILDIFPTENVKKNLNTWLSYIIMILVFNKFLWHKEKFTDVQLGRHTNPSKKTCKNVSWVVKQKVSSTVWI